jgi:hypothetical protein
VNISLFLAALWAVVGVGVLLWPVEREDGSIGIDPTRRLWLAGFTVLLVGYNLTRFWFAARSQRRAQERRAEDAVRRAAWFREHSPESPNPDFDFSEPDKRGDREDPPR